MGNGVKNNAGHVCDDNHPRVRYWEYFGGMGQSGTLIQVDCPRLQTVRLPELNYRETGIETIAIEAVILDNNN